MYTPTLSYAQEGLKPSIKSSDKAQEQAKEKEKRKGPHQQIRLFLRKNPFAREKTPVSIFVTTLEKE